MIHKRHLRVLRHALAVALVAVLGLAGIRVFLDTVGTRGWTPAAFFIVLLLVGAVALTWRAAIDLRRAVRRL